MNPRAIEVHIEELVLHGFSPGTQRDVAEGLQNHLQTLLAQRGVPYAWRANPERIDADRIRMNSQSNPTLAGAQIAGAVFNTTHSNKHQRRLI
jgi:hypothetical protein